MRRPADPRAYAAGVLLACAGLTSCAPQFATGSNVPGVPQNASRLTARAFASPAPATPIKHVVILMQENRSFDNLFQGFPGADTRASGLDSKGNRVKLQPVPLEAQYGLDHNAGQMFLACNGSGSIPGTACKMDGFDLETAYGQKIPADPEYGYVPHQETRPYFAMAQQYVLADRMFTSHIDASFVSHQYIIAGQAAGAVNLPTGTWGCAGGGSDTVQTLNADRSYGSAETPCFSYATIGSELDQRGLPWRFYAMGPSDTGSIWSAYQANAPIFNGPDWQTDVENPSSAFLSDVGNGKLAAVTWVMPSFRNSDHATSYSKTGPDWVASVVNAVGESQFWDSTAIFVMWDEWGGWYDHVPPPHVDYDGLGFRVPLLIVSPYAKQGHVSHVQYEHGSILKFVEDTFGLPRLAASDARANSPAPDCFEFTKPPRAFVPIKTKLSKQYFLNEPLDPRPPDEE